MARCKWCKHGSNRISISSMGASALKRHQTHKKHSEIAKNMGSQLKLGLDRNSKAVMIAKRKYIVKSE